MYIYVCIYIYIYIYPRRGGLHEEAGRPEAKAAVLQRRTVSFRNFKSQVFKSSVSNPKSKYVAYVSVLSQISNCQSLGRKNKHEILKTDRRAR